MSGLPEPLTRQARLFQAAALIALVLVALNLLREAGVVAFAFGRPQPGGVEVLDSFLVGLIPLLPTVILLSAVESARRLFGRVAKGELFGARNAKSIAAIGTALWQSALATMVVVPFLLAIVGADRMRVRVESESLVIFVVGAAMMVLGQLMARAQAESAALRAELSDFV